MFGLFEVSSQSGKPVGLYEFVWGNDVWRYTSADIALQFPYIDGDPNNGVWWQPAAISDGGVDQSADAVEFEVDLPANLPVVTLFRATPPSESVWLTVKRFHFTDPDQEPNTIWVGTISNIKRKNRGLAKAIGMPISATMRRTGLRLCWELACPHMLYDEGCKVDKLAFQTIATVVSLNGADMEVDDLGLFAGADYNGGFAEWDASLAGTIERRGLEQYLGANTFRMFGTTDRMVVGMPIRLFLGCDLSAATCQARFNNLPNHGGFGFMPLKSPFDGKPIF